MRLKRRSKRPGPTTGELSVKQPPPKDPGSLGLDLAPHVPPSVSG